jgi:hypothetical protein
VNAWNLATMLRGPTPERTYVSPSGVPTTVLATHVDYEKHLAVVAIALGLLTAMLTQTVRDDFRVAVRLEEARASHVGLRRSAFFTRAMKRLPRN